MPAITSGLVLVTGASGFIGTHTVRELLKAGFDVRAAVRSPAKGEHIQSLFPAQKARISYTIVENMDEDGAYDEAVKGVDGVLHLASPVSFDYPDPQTMIDEAVRGVVNILKSAREHGKGIKRVEVISSVVALGFPFGGPARYDESSWNDQVMAMAAEQGAKADGFVKYIASKVAAERAFWDFYEKNDVKFDAVAVLPGLVFGPSLKYNPDGEITGSHGFAVPFLGPTTTEAQLREQLYPIVDVRDIAYASAQALQVPEAAGERFLVARTAPALFGNHIAIAANEAFPSAPIGKGRPELEEEIQKTAVVFDGGKAAHVLGVEYRDMEETLRITVQEVYPKLAKQGAN